MHPDRALVLGAPRSGTTFLLGVLDALPGAECVMGNLLPVGLVHLAAQELPAQTREVLERSFRGSMDDYLASGAYLSRSAALRKWWVADRSPGGLRRAARGAREEQLLVYKEPFLAFAPEFAYSAVPDARMIYIVRDGRDVANSLVRSYDVLSDEKLHGLESNEMMIGRRAGDRFVPWWVGDGEEEQFLSATPYVRAIWMWREMVTRSAAFLERADVAASGRVLVVRYEELVSDPQRGGEAIASHLGRTLTPRMRTHLGGAHPRSIGAHRKRAPGELAAAEAIAGPALMALGYTLATDALAAGAAAA